MGKEIKGCPFCGSDASLYANWNRRMMNWFVFVQCDFCNGSGKSFLSISDPEEMNWDNDACNKAIDAWNKRVN
jgi:hypothetical protein